MIYLITGQPGSGKTLLTIDELRKETQRPIYYSGIPDLKLPWTELEKPEEWPDCPPGSIIVIDEAQRAFRPRGSGSVVPQHVAALETHRHAGHDLYIITQHPMLIDGNIRRLVGEHRHVVRAFGSRVANVHRWSEVKTNPDQNRKDGIVTTRHYPADVYNLYKSADVHTHKLRLPPRLIMLVLAPILLAGISYGIYTWQQGMVEDDRIDKLVQSKGVPASEQASPISPEGVQSVTSMGYSDLSAFVPRIEGIAESAPRYDEITKPKQAPRIAGCVASTRDCRCYMPGGERYPTTEGICRHVAAHGAPWYDWVEPAEAGGASAAASPASAGSMPANQSAHEPREAGQIVSAGPRFTTEDVVAASAYPRSMSWDTWFALRNMREQQQTALLQNNAR